MLNLIPKKFWRFFKYSKILYKIFKNFFQKSLLSNFFNVPPEPKFWKPPSNGSQILDGNSTLVQFQRGTQKFVLFTLTRNKKYGKICSECAKDFSAKPNRDNAFDCEISLSALSWLRFQMSLSIPIKIFKNCWLHRSSIVLLLTVVSVLTLWIGNGTEKTNKFSSFLAFRLFIF